MDRQFTAVLLCFALSGCAALLYQTAWLREFAFVFGTADLAVVSVLAAYMAGLAGGAAIAARFSGRVRRPVLVYGALELGIALCALAVPWAIRGATGLYVWALGSLPAPPDEGQLGATVFFAVCAFAILAVPTGLMGVTLPLLARYAVRREDQIGSRIGVLYAVNTLGAVVGTLCAAWVLLPAIGLRNTVYVGVAINGLVFAVATLLARSAAPLASGATPTVRSAPGSGAAWILPLMTISGVTSFSYEVLWTRLLGQILGGSIHAFATMLASFLLGIALGSAVAARLARTRRRSAWGFATAQLGAAALSIAAFNALDSLPGWAREIGASSRGSLAANAAIAAALLLPGALCFGATFPFAVRLLARDENQAAPASARVYAWNTAGGVVGALSAGLFGLPLLGFAGVVRAAVAVNLGLALAAALLARPTLRVVGAAALAGLALLAVLPPSPPWRILRSNPGTGVVTRGQVTHFGVGRSATVLLLDDGLTWKLSTNGMSEAEIQRVGARPGAAATTRWLALLPVLARPETKSLLLVGLGGGLTLQAVPSTVERIDVIELEPEVVRANLAVAALRDSDPLADPRVEIRVNDARGALLLTDARYDAIVSQPSHPWTAGASHLYTREFFALVSEHLEPGGVFAQWIGMGFVDEKLLQTLVATLLDVFPNVRLYQPVPGSVVFLASNTPLLVGERASAALAAAPDDFGRFGLRTLEDIAAGLALDEAGAREFARGAPINTDQHNLVAARSPRLRSRERLASGGALRVFAGFDPLAERAEKLDRGYLHRRLISAAGIRRAARFAATLDDPAEAEAARGWLDLAAARPLAARLRFRAALELDPDSREARAGLLLVARRPIARGGGEDLLAGLDPLDPPSIAVVAGWRAGELLDWEGLRDLDSQLAAVDVRHPLFAEAVRLRAIWRIEGGDPALGAEALKIVDAITAVGPVLSDLLLRARAAARAGLAHGALSTLREMIPQLRSPAQVRPAIALLDELPANFQKPLVARMRAQLERVMK